MELHTNSSNNTIYADADGNIAYFHANFIPKRDTKFDWSKPVDGSDPATEWNGVHVDRRNARICSIPPSGWLYNTNNWPWSAAGSQQPEAGELSGLRRTNGARIRAAFTPFACSSNKKDFTLDSLIAAAYDSYLPLRASRPGAAQGVRCRLPASNPLKAKLAEQIAAAAQMGLRAGRSSSVPTSLAVFWGEEIGQRRRRRAKRGTIG